MANNCENIKRLKEIHQQEEEIYSQKCKLFGDSFPKIIQEYGPVAVLSYLSDKLARISNLATQGQAEDCKELTQNALVDNLMDLSNYANMFIMELKMTPSLDTQAKEPSKKKRNKSKNKDSQKKEDTTSEKGPMDSLTKKELAQVVTQLGGTVPKKPNRETLIGIINDYPKANVAVAITSLKAKATEDFKEEENEEEE